MISLGLDFGSTNTLVSVYHADGDYPETINIHTFSNRIPSYVAWAPNSNEYFFGQTAVDKIGNPNYRIIRAFKMMLQVQDPEILAERGFDEVNTPEKISELFIKNVLENALDTVGEHKIDVLTVGIPEIWRAPGDGIHRNAHTIIRDICERIGLAREIRIVTEPEAAAAYYAFNYAKSNNNANFCGHILIVDYGGGTLDLTLSTVNPLKDNMPGKNKSSIKYNMQIKTVKRTGGGEVTYEENSGEAQPDYSVGIAGIAYMEAVVDRVLEENGISPREVREQENGQFSQLVLSLEKELINGSVTVKKYFGEDSFTKIMNKHNLRDMEEDKFCEIGFWNKYFSVSYGTLASVYKETIADKFAEEMNVIMEYMKQENIRYMDGSTDKFQLALVGGFGNFCLVEKQLISILSITAFANGIVGQNNRENAIANGASLYANNIVGHQLTSPYSLGIRLQKGLEGQETLAYAFHHLDEMKADKEFFVIEKGEQRPVMLKNSTNFQNVFFSETDHSSGRKETFSLKMKPECYTKLKEMITGSNVRYYNMSFSMDEEEHITVNIYGYDRIKKERAEKPVIQEKLSELGELFITEKSSEGRRKRGNQ